MGEPRTLWSGGGGPYKVLVVVVVVSLCVGVEARGAPTADPAPYSLRLEGGVDPQQLLPNCSQSSAQDFPSPLFTLEQRQHGAILLHFALSIYLFYSILIICDEYFIPAVESICSELGVPSDVAGATFMAISTSAPELFTNMIGTFLTGGDLGVGTIVGSAVFNVLAMGACCGIGAGYSITKLSNSQDKIGIRLDWWPLTRDVAVYLVSVGALIIVLYNRRVYWHEALLMICLYLIYVLVLCFNSKIKRCVESFILSLASLLSLTTGIENKPKRISIVIGQIVGGNGVGESCPLLLKVTEKNGNVPNYTGVASASTEELFLSRQFEIPAESLDKVLVENALSASSSSSPAAPLAGRANWERAKEHEQDGRTSRQCNFKCPAPAPSSPLLPFLLSFPIRLALSLTIPDCKLPSLRKYFWATLMMCVVWIGGITYLISWMVTIIGDTFNVPDSVTGLTFLAAGTSIPEVISSIIVARQGLGSMGFSNTIGSNTFDVLICLGLPWLIKAALLSEDPRVDYIEIHSRGMEYSAIILVLAVLLLYLMIAFNGFILERWIGWSCVVMYVVFISIASMLEMNVFFQVNLPPCTP